MGSNTRPCAACRFSDRPCAWAAEPPPGDARLGEQLYAQKNCNLCHSLGGISGPLADLGGSLDNLAERRDMAWLRRYLCNPAATLSGAQMPLPDLNPAEIEDVGAFLLSR
ncbi:MAG: cytochrome c [Chromatiaceae bacterium]|nr:cytochrome c [Chromatiaceae bacterium]